jgi:AcrR family transcriptional regulator
VAISLRADAQRNLGLVLDAAAEAFAEHGPDVTIDEIARRAGVGHGTVCRRFPTKDALMAAVVGKRIGELTGAARELLERPDPGAAFDAFVWHAAESCRRDRVLFESTGRCDTFAAVTAAKDELRAVVESLILRAREDGALRDDLTADDVGSLIGSVMQASTRPDRPDAWRRHIQIILDGLRSPHVG